MRVWICPSCKAIREWEKPLVMKICHNCQVEMEVYDDGQG